MPQTRVGLPFNKCWLKIHAYHEHSRISLCLYNSINIFPFQVQFLPNYIFNMVQEFCAIHLHLRHHRRLYPNLRSNPHHHNLYPQSQTILLTVLLILHILE